MITGGIITCAGSGKSYLKITLEKAIQEGDFLVTESVKDGGNV